MVSGLCNALGVVVEKFRCKVCAVRSRNGPSVDVRFGEEFGILQWFEHLASQFALNIHLANLAVGEVSS